MSIGKGGRKTYTKLEKQVVACKSLKYRSLIQAGKALGVSATTIGRWQKQIGLYSPLFRCHNSKKREELIGKSKEYKTEVAACQHLGVTESTLIRWKKEKGVFQRKKRQYSKEEKAFFVRELDKYETFAKAAKALEVPLGTLNQFRRDLGVVSQHRNRRLHIRYTEAQRQDFAQRSVEYPNLFRAADAFGVAHNSVSRWCQQYGVPIKRTLTKYSEEEKKKAEDIFRKVKTIREVAQITKIPRDRVRRWKEKWVL